MISLAALLPTVVKSQCDLFFCASLCKGNLRLSAGFNASQDWTCGAVNFDLLDPNSYTAIALNRFYS